MTWSLITTRSAFQRNAFACVLSFAFMAAASVGCSRGSDAPNGAEPSGQTPASATVVGAATTPASANSGGDGHDHGSGGSPLPPEGSGPAVPPTTPEFVADAPLPPIEARPAGRIIDAHTHLSGWEIWPEVQSVMDENNLDFVFNLSGGSPRGGQTLAMMLAEDSGGRVVNLMNVDWEGIDEVAFGDVLAAELELLVTQYGYVGLKISKALGLYARDGRGDLIAVDDPRLFPLWRKAGELGVPVFIHTSDPLAFWDPITPQNERYAELNAHPSWSFAGPEFPPRQTLLDQRNHIVSLFTETTFVGVHFGNNPEDLSYVDRVLSLYPNFYVDLSARIPEIGRHDPDEVRELFVRHQDRILFATDMAVVKRRGQVSYTLGSSGETPATRADVAPFFAACRQFLETNDAGIAHPTPIQGDWTIDAIGLPQDVLDKVYYLNAYRLVLEGRNVRVQVPRDR